MNKVLSITTNPEMTPVTYGVHYAIERYLGSELATVMKRKAAEN